MLEKVICIDNVGVIKKGTQRPVTLPKVALVYADNARGKSTFSALLQSCASFDATGLQERLTVGANTPQKVKLRFKPVDGKPAFSVDFDGAAWTGTRPNLHVFNQSFVEKNVYTSNDVSTGNREALLSLALGDAAVTKKTAHDEQTQIQRDAAMSVTSAENALLGYRGTLTVAQFVALKPNTHADTRIAEIDRQIALAQVAGQIAQRPVFREVTVPTFDLSSIVAVLANSFESLADEAAQVAKAHFTKHNGASTERWVSEGLGHHPDQDCPFCGQSTEGLPLLDAYKSYFDAAYVAHMSKVNVLRQDVRQKLTSPVFAGWSTASEINAMTIRAWAAELQPMELPSLNPTDAQLMLDSFLEEALKLADEKEKSPLTAIDTEIFNFFDSTLQGLTLVARAYNEAVSGLNARIKEYREQVVNPDVVALTSERATLALNKIRFSAEVLPLIEAVKAAKAVHKDAEAAKTKAREELDALMEEVLASFQASINHWLVEFAAPFQVEKLAPNYQGGGSVRSEYVLKVRGTTVRVGPGAPGALTFHAALSEGDKRTLAFAFFLARLFADPDRASATVALDDVFTSLDKHRRFKTLNAILRMSKECDQAIILGHDAYFLRDARIHLRKKKQESIGEFSLYRDADDFSYLDQFDLDDYCSSEYYKHYVRVEKFVGADRTVSQLEVAQSLRPLMEGHLHRCFPKKFKEGQTVGDMVGEIGNASASNPISRLQRYRAELGQFNDFVAAFHHDTSGGHPRTEVTEGELLPFAKSVLGFIQVRALKPD